MPDGIDTLFAFARETLEEIGREALAYYGKGDARQRFDQDLVTEAEIRLRERFQEGLSRTFPNHSVHGNAPDQGNYLHGEKRYLWVFDPIDGVANFQAGIPLWGMSLALLENFWPLFGMFLMPTTGDLFHARAGQKAFRGDTRIGVHAAAEINDESLLLTYSRFHLHHRTSFPGKIRSFGCVGAHMCCVAMGRAEAVLLANVSFQGMAAAVVIVEAAGGKCCDLQGQAVHLNGLLDGRGPLDPILVAAPETVPQVLGCLGPLE